MTDPNEAPAQAGSGEARLETRTGVILRVTRARPQDKDEVREFFRNVSPDDLRFRFLETVKEVSEPVLQSMVDSGPDITFLARREPDGLLVSVATLASTGDGEKGEVALSTRADHKKKGISWSLLQHVLNFAKDRGYRVVSSLEAADNREAIRLQREMGFIARLNSADPPEVLASKNL